MAADRDQGRERARRPAWRALRWEEELAPLAVLALLAVVIAAREPTFLTFENLRNVVTRSVPLGLTAVGQTVVIVCGQIDLSVGSVEALSAVAAALLLQAGCALWLAVVAAVGLGGLCGLVNGLVTTKARIPSFVVTLAMMGLARGLALVVTGGLTVSGADSLKDWVVTRNWLGFPLPVYAMVFLAAAVSLLLSRTTLGRHVYATGANPTAAQLSGVRVDRNIVLAFVLSGALVGGAGVIDCGRIASAPPTMGALLELDAIAVAVIGGASLLGGQGTVRGTLVGVAIMAVLRNGCNLLNIPNEWEKVVIGPLIVLAVLYDRAVKGRRRRGIR